MTERKPGEKTLRQSKIVCLCQPPERERKRQFSEVTIAALTGEVSGEHLYNPNSPYGRGSTSGMYLLDRAVPDLAERGYVIDLRPLADNLQITTWVFQAPMSNSRIEGDDINHLPGSVRKAAGDMLVDDN